MNKRIETRCIHCNTHLYQGGLHALSSGMAAVTLCFELLHRGTKFLAGHNDTISGFLCSADQALGDRVRLLAKMLGNTLSPFDAWLTLRGIKTLAIRMERQQETAKKLADWLVRQPNIQQVYYKLIRQLLSARQFPVQALPPVL